MARRSSDTIDYRTECSECGSLVVSDTPRELCYSCEETLEEARKSSTFHTRHGKTFKEQREKALESANWKCEECGLTNEEHVQRDDLFPPHGGLHVDHIIPTREFSEDEMNNAHELSNLQVLCDDCHKQKTAQEE